MNVLSEILKYESEFLSHGAKEKKSQVFETLKQLGLPGKEHVDFSHSHLSKGLQFRPYFGRENFDTQIFPSENLLSFIEQYLMKLSPRLAKQFRNRELPVLCSFNGQWTLIEHSPHECIRLTLKTQSALLSDSPIPQNGFECLQNLLMREENSLHIQFLSSASLTLPILNFYSEKLVHKMSEQNIQFHISHQFGSSLSLLEDHFILNNFDFLNVEENAKNPQSDSQNQVMPLPMTLFQKIVLHQSGEGQTTYIQMKSSGMSDYSFEQTSIHQNFQVKLNSPHTAFHLFTLEGTVPGLKIRKNQWVELMSPRSEFHHYGLHHLKPSTQNSMGFTEVDLNSKIIHRSSYSISRQNIKTILHSEHRHIFTGTVFIDKNLEQVDAEQKIMAQINGKKAESIATPILDVLSDDVKCAHGATTGPLSSDELFYLESRGMHPTLALDLLNQGFIVDLLGQLPHHLKDLQGPLGQVLL